MIRVIIIIIIITITICDCLSSAPIYGTKSEATCLCIQTTLFLDRRAIQTAMIASGSP